MYSLNDTHITEPVLRVFSYFDIFNYPLTKNEVREFVSVSATANQISACIDDLAANRTIYRLGEFYSLQNNPDLADKRAEGNKRAGKLFPKAIKIGRYFYRFPFVRAVGISGSLSKNYADEKADIDFFIITKANRLWIARTDLHLFKKTKYLTGQQHLYCMNYFIDEHELLIKEQNIYTAIEIKTLIPVAGKETFEKFFQVNNWVNSWFPNAESLQKAKLAEKKPFSKVITETLLNNSRLDNILFRWTQRRWEKKMKKGKKNMKGNVMGLITHKHFAKSDPESFQQKILDRLEEKMHYLRKKWPQYF